MRPVANLKNTREAAAALGVSSSNLKRRRKRGQGPPWVKIGARVLYRDEDLRRFVEERVMQPTEEEAA
jgi:hypothetical protein